MATYKIYVYITNPTRDPPLPLNDANRQPVTHTRTLKHKGTINVIIYLFMIYFDNFSFVIVFVRIYLFIIVHKKRYYFVSNAIRSTFVNFQDFFGFFINYTYLYCVKIANTLFIINDFFFLVIPINGKEGT